MKLIREIEDDTITYFSGQKKILWIKEILNESSVDVFIGGELLSETTHEFQDEIMALASVGMDINIDLSDVTYIAASYMQALLKIQVSIDQNGKGNMKLKNLPPPIQNNFDKTGITELLWIE